MAFEDMHRPLGRAGFRGATKWILLLTGGTLLLELLLQQWPIYHQRFLLTLGLVPALVVQKYWLWQLVTYMFLHGGFFHWAFNMLVMYMFGRELETRWGTYEYVKYLIICGLGAAVCVLLASPQSLAPTIGSSGAVFGLLVAFAMVFPDATMYLYLVIPVKAWQAAALFAVIEFFAALNGGGAGIGRFAHLGGMLTGYLYLRFGWDMGRSFRSPWSRLESWWSNRKRRSAPTRPKVELHEVTDDMVEEVDRILDKILKQGVESLTPEEKRIMDRYSRLKK